MPGTHRLIALARRSPDSPIGRTSVNGDLDGGRDLVFTMRTSGGA
jgi:hypothetical protein